MLAKAKFFSFKKGFSLKEKILWFSQEQLQKTMIFGFMAAIIGLGIFFSRSRSGIFIFFITIFLMIVALSAIGGKEPNGPSQGTESPGIRGKRFAKILRTVFLLVVFSVVSIGIRPIIERFSLENLKKEERPVYYKNSLDLIKSFFLTGTGPGTFVYAYPMFDKKASEGLLDHAHNDYLEMLAESGVVGGGCLILAAYTALGYIIKRWKKRSGYFGKGVILGCVLGITAILVHSLSDFNLRIPSNAVYFVTLYALAIRQTLDYENRIQQG
jgi:O-antigen ligase